MFFITTMGKEGKCPRTVGYVETFEEAEDIVLNNKYDIFEYTFDYAVIENVPSGIYQYDQNPNWYKWNHDKECYEKIEKPDFAKGFIGWGIG